MKTRLFTLMALVLGMASCQRDFTAGNEAGGEVDVQLAVAVPELIGATRANSVLDSANGAIDYLTGAEVSDARTDWSDVDLRYSLEVYDKDGNEPIKDRIVVIQDEYDVNGVTFSLRLIPKREYKFVIFADFVPQGASATADQTNLGERHIIDGNLRNIKIDQTKDNINDELADAYFKSFLYEPSNNTNNEINNVVLTRPYGKIRVVATDLADLNLNLQPGSVEVTYSDVLVPQGFDAFSGAITTESSTRTFTYAYVDKVRFENHNMHLYNSGYDAIKDQATERYTHMTLFTDYILASETQHAVSFKMGVKDQDGVLIKQVDFDTDIPVQRNYLTTIIGNVMTANTVVKVTIDDNFANEYVEPYEIPYLGDEAKDPAATTYEGDAFANGYMQNALWFNNYHFAEDAAIVIENETYNAIILENCIGKFKNDVITVKNNNSCVMILQNLDFTLAEGKKLIKSVNPYYQVFMANIKINGELMTQESMAQYLENVVWYQVVEEI